MAATTMARGTQSFVRVLSECWSRPGLLALEILWRWLFGIPLIVVLVWQGLRIYSAVAGQLAAAGVNQLSLTDPMGAAPIIVDAYAVVAPPILRAVLWLAPLAALTWGVASGVGRNAVLRRYDASLPRRPIALSALQLLRIIFLGASFWLWFASVQWAANHSLSGDEPDLVTYSALVIFISLGIFILWAVVSWVFSIAPLLVLLENRDLLSSLLRSLRLGPLTGKLIEINLVMGIVKLALIVVAMVFSAIPLPFESVVQGPPLYAWWVVVTLLYLVASDFFQVARLVAFIELWRVLSTQALSAKTAVQVK
ncbi:MAG: hypothetical protein JO300_15940 [Silvibacterium sp.]|nr:hypothetical protein [Silvibacterium sp.]MBV8435898.1 hypothetical protein [Silvibacterium sp.]